MIKRNYKSIIIGILFIITFVAFDQVTKYLAVTKLKDNDPFVILDGVFEFLYVENRGAAWGAFAGKLGMFIALTFIIIPLIIWTICRINQMIEFFGKKVNIKALRFLQINLVLLIAGAIGNLIDRMINGFVVDFIYFKLIDFPVFNIADCYITVATALFLIISLFFFKNNELDYLTCSKKKWKIEDECK